MRSATNSHRVAMTLQQVNKIIFLDYDQLVKQ